MDNNGIYQAIVTDNNSFFNTGKIRVRVQKLYNTSLDWDMSSTYNKKEFITNLVDDIDALVYTPIGGGSNHGLFALPQINSVGLIQFISGDINKAVWMGAFFRPEYDDKNNLIRCNVPNDQLYFEGMGADGIARGASNEKYARRMIKGGDGTVILRTKTTQSPIYSNSKDTINFDKRRSENLVVLSGDEIKLVHFSEWKDKEKGNSADLNQYEEITIGTYKEYNRGRVIREYPQITIQVVDKDSDEKNRQTTGIKITAQEVSLEVVSKKNNIKSKIGATPEGINIESKRTNEDKTTSFRMTPEDILVENKTSNIKLTPTTISLSSPDGDILLSGRSVRLGDGGGYVMISDVPIPARTEAGNVIKTSSVRA